MKVQISRVVLEAATDKSLGLLLVEGLLVEGLLVEGRRSGFTVKFQFPDGRELFSPEGDYRLEAKYVTLNCNQVNLDCEQDEGFRLALGSFATLCPQRLEEACEALFSTVELR